MNYKRHFQSHLRQLRYDDSLSEKIIVDLNIIIPDFTVSHCNKDHIARNLNIKFLFEGL